MFVQRFTSLILGAILILSAASSACTGGGGGGGGGEVTVNGTVTRVDTSARTFSIRTNDGKDLDFKMVNNSKGDIREIKEHFDLKKPIEVKYRGNSSPYEVGFAD
ncbi:MAG: hypothetical protein U0556_12640 [Dehalococcoidia bacterium]